MLSSELPMPRRLVTQDATSFAFRNYELPLLNAHDIRVRVAFAAPKHGTESHVIGGSAFDRKKWDPDLRLFLPRPANEPVPGVPAERGIGNIVVGTVVETGSDVERFAVGDRVFGYGPVCEVHQATESAWQALGDMSYENAVCTDPAHVAFVAVRDGNVRIGDDVAVFGLGAIGLLTVQTARAGGARRVFAIDPVALRRDFAVSHGADMALDPASGDVALQIKRATDNSGVDVALETSGSGRALHEAIRCIRQCGTIVHVPWGPRDASTLHLDEEFHLNRPTLIGSQAVWDNPDRSHPLWTEQRARYAATDLLRKGLLTGKGIVTPIVSFEEAPDTLANVFAQPEHNIKVGIRFDED
jgi:threonine dehydrogenase-like Zn-dependent dehydrogenase